MTHNWEVLANKVPILDKHNLIEIRNKGSRMGHPNKQIIGMKYMFLLLTCFILEKT